MTDDTAEQVKSRLRQVQFPGFQRNIVSMGFVKGIKVEGEAVTIDFTPDTRNEEKVLQMEENIRKELSGLNGIAEVKIIRSVPYDGSEEKEPTSGELPPELRDSKGVGPGSEKDDPNLRRPTFAPDAGYGDDGPASFGGPEKDMSEAASERYEGKMRVLQWDIDPNDPTFESGEANTKIGNWEYRVWWQIHPDRLVYASVHALKEDWVDHTGVARPHPVGRAEAVNLVYDLDRKAVVAVYGTVRDFRPFIEAFHEGYAP